MLGTVCPKSVSHISIVSVFYTNYLSRICAFTDVFLGYKIRQKCITFSYFFYLPKTISHPPTPPTVKVFFGLGSAWKVRILDQAVITLYPLHSTF